MSQIHKREIIELHNTMYEYTIEAGINSKKYYGIIAEIDEYSLNELIELRNWLQKIRYNQFAEVKKVKNYLPQEIWLRYKIMGVTDFREQKVLEVAQKALKQAWLRPYRTEAQKERIRQKKKIIVKSNNNEKISTETSATDSNKET